MTHPTLSRKQHRAPTLGRWRGVLNGVGLLLVSATLARGAAATLLFEDDFDRGLPGWTAVQPPGNYLDGPMRWQHDLVSGAFIEQSNIYTDASTASPSAVAAMLINDTPTDAPFTYRARLIAGDDDGFGLIFGYRDAGNFFRVTFTRQNRTTPGYPWNGWNVDRMVDGVATNLFGDGTADHIPSFINTQYVPFDVTLAVDSENRLTLTVVEDPEGAPIDYPLVEGQPLPASADGQVGLTTWGMSGSALRGFRMANLDLSPTPLTEGPEPLAEWTPVVTQRADGSQLDPGSGNGGVPIWSLALGPSGAYGTLHENSDSFGGNDADGVVDFSSAALVAGDAGWSDYFVTARLQPSDDDAHGILLRYQDEQNFYRVTLRGQQSATGPARGLSIQKVVGGVWEEVFHEDTPQYVPSTLAPFDRYDLSASILGNRLQVQLTVNPDGTAQVFDYGPFDITGATLPSGRIGLFSWAMSRMEFDWVRVEGIEGLPLIVTSPYGNPNPASGLNGFAPGTPVEASAGSPIEESPGLRRVATGWTGTGSVPASGSGDSVTFTLNTISSLTWQWRTDLRLQVTSGAGGQVLGRPTDDWLPEGSEFILTAQADAGYVFSGWSGDLAATSPQLDIDLTRPLTLEAQFEADTDNDTLPDSWELAELKTLGAGPDDDTDQDGLSNRAEYERGSSAGFAETVALEPAYGSRWENVQRDPFLPGQIVVRDFGGGFRGAWENSNDYREAVDARFIGEDAVVPGVSFDGPRLVLTPEAWDSAWRDFTASTVFSVGDNDANCVYFRYQDENNWYRVTVCGENNNLDWRAPFGVTVQKRVNGFFSLLAEDASIATDPADTSFYKRIRVTVSAQGSNFEVRVTGWDTFVLPPEWNVFGEAILSFSDTDLANGRFGVGTWGQSGGGSATELNPVSDGALIEDVVVTVGGQEVLREDWEQAPPAEDLPAGWDRSEGAPAGTWRRTAHGTILQIDDALTSSTGTAAQPRADGEGPILLAPTAGVANYLLELGFHPFDDDGIGFVYDYHDADNFSRVLFVSEASGPGRNPQGVSISRKSNGLWSDIVAGDPSFIYVNGSPFHVEFANNQGRCRLTAQLVDDPSTTRSWSWNGPAGTAEGRIGLTCWGESDAHFLPVTIYGLQPTEAGGDLRIGQVSIAAGVLMLDVINPDGTPYAVEQSTLLRPDSWTVAADSQTAGQWTTPVNAAPGGTFYRLRRLP